MEQLKIWNFFSQAYGLFCKLFQALFSVVRFFFSLIKSVLKSEVPIFNE